MNGYLSRSYKILGPTVNPSPHVSGIAFREWQEKTASGILQCSCRPFYLFQDGEQKPSLLIDQHRGTGVARIHPFINGNGRHARLITDIFFHSVKHPPPKWPQIQLLSEGDQVRSRYIEAMKAADRENYRELMAFMKEFVE